VKTIPITKDGKIVSEDEAFMTTQNGNRVLRDGYGLRVSMTDAVPSDPVAAALLAALAAPAPVRSAAIVDGAGAIGLNSPGFRFQSHAVADAARVTQDFLKEKSRSKYIAELGDAWRDRKPGDLCHAGNGVTGRLAWGRNGNMVCVPDQTQSAPQQASETGDRARPDFAGQRAARDAYTAELTDAWRRH
jgi:hypothetical protein